MYTRLNTFYFPRCRSCFPNEQEPEPDPEPDPEPEPELEPEPVGAKIEGIARSRGIVEPEPEPELIFHK